MLIVEAGAEDRWRGQRPGSNVSIMTMRRHCRRHGSCNSKACAAGTHFSKNVKAQGEDKGW
jgi:hypothetical protein